MAGLSDLAIRILINAQDRTGPAVDSARTGQRSIADSLTRVETIAKRVVSVALFANWAQEGIALSDAYKGLTGRLQQTVGETGNLVAKQGAGVQYRPSKQHAAGADRSSSTRAAARRWKIPHGQALAANDRTVIFVKRQGHAASSSPYPVTRHRPFGAGDSAVAAHFVYVG